MGDPEYDRIVGGGQLGVVGGAGAVVSDVNQLVARAGLQAVHGDHNAHLGLGLIAGPGSIQHEGLVVLAGQAIDDNAVLLVGLKADGIGNFAAGGNLLNDGIADSVHNAHSRVGLLFGDRDGGISSDVLGHLNSLGNHDALVGGVQDVGGQLVGGLAGGSLCKSGDGAQGRQRHSAEHGKEFLHSGRTPLNSVCLLCSKFQDY